MEGACPYCGSDDYRYQELAELLYQPDAAGNFPEIPEPWPELEPVWASYGRIPRMEGTPVVTCQDAWLARHGVTDPEEIFVWEDLWAVIAGEQAAVSAERMERPTDDGPEE